MKMVAPVPVQGQPQAQQPANVKPKRVKQKPMTTEDMEDMSEEEEPEYFEDELFEDETVEPSNADRDYNKYRKKKRGISANINEMEYEAPEPEPRPTRQRVPQGPALNARSRGEAIDPDEPTGELELTDEMVRLASQVGDGEIQLTSTPTDDPMQAARNRHRSSNGIVDLSQGGQNSFDISDVKFRN